MPTVPADQAVFPYRQPAEVVVAQLQSDLSRGLTTAEAQARLARYGRNELPSTPPPPAWRKFLAQFQNPLTILLLVATVISFVAWLIEREEVVPYETLTILAIVILNAILGYIQERRAEEAVAALQAMSAPTARVLRDGQPQTAPAAEVVPGDILLIEEGDTFPADARVLESIALRVAEAALTGESSPVSKEVQAIPEEVGIGDQQNMVFSSTAATAGRGRAIVTSTGANTEIGRIAGSLQQQQEEPTPLQRELDGVGKLLGVIVVVIAILMSAVLLLVNRDARSVAQLVDILLLGVSLAVAAVPEGLTAITTIVLSLGMQRMAKRNVIVRKLSAVESLGSTTVIGTDKTGTLTKNEMTVRTVLAPGGRFDLTGIGYEPKGDLMQHGQPVTDESMRQQARMVLALGALANNAHLVQQDGRWAIQGDPTEGALIVAAEKLGIKDAELGARFQRVGEVPFSSERKMMSAFFTDAQRAGQVAIAAKGAPDVLLARCTHERVGEAEVPLTPQRVAAIQVAIDSLAHEALRTLGVAYRYLHQDEASGAFSEDHEQELVFAGVVGMIDPPRTEAAVAVQTAKLAGVRTIMITGDHPTTAAAIAAELGIAAADAPALNGMELQRTDDAALQKLVHKFSVFARVAPDHKLRIVRALKADGAIVAMTGDGVNDAPALKAADIGVAMGVTGTDVAKGAADMVLTDDNYASIVAAVEEGRSIFANIQKFLRYLLSSNAGEVMVMFFGVLLAGIIGLAAAEEGAGLIAPLLATQILWINLVTDAAPALALGLEPADPDVMRRSPRNPRSRVINRLMWFEIVFVGLVMALSTLAVMDWGLPGGLIPGENGSAAYAQTLAFTTLVLAQLFNAVNSRSSTASVFHQLWTNKWLWGAIALGALLQVAVVYLPFLNRPFGTVPLSALDWVVCIAAASTVLWTRELVKIFQRRRLPEVSLGVDG